MHRLPARLSLRIDAFLPLLGPDSIERVRARFFVVGCAVFASVALVLPALYAFAPDVAPMQILPLTALAVPSLGAPFLLRRGVSLTVLTVSLLALSQAALAWSAVADRGIDDVAMLWLVASPLFAALAGGARAGILTAVTASLAAGTLLGVAETGYVFPNPLGDVVARRYHTLNVGLAAAFVAGLAWLYEGPLLARTQALNQRLGLLNGDLRRELAARRQAQAEAEAASRAKDVLLANLSHEFRTPLTAVLSGLELLEDEVPERDRVLVQSIGRGAHRLLATLTGVLDLVHIESGAATATTPLDVGALVGEAMESLEAAASAKGLDIARDLPRRAHGAPVHASALRQLLALLFDNAARFTETGAIGVRVDADAEGVEIVVSDTGIGMLPAFLARATEPFVQASEGQGRTHEGLGLGLAIADRLARSMGGTLTIESTLGVGTTVRVGLPAMPLPPAAAAPQAPVRAAARLTPVEA